MPAELLEAAIAAAPVGLVLLDGEGRVQLANREFTRLFGYETADAVGRPLADLLCDSGQPPELAEALRRLLAGEAVSLETWCRRKEGGRLAVAFTGAPVPGASAGNAPGGGRLLGACCVLADVTDRRSAEEESARAASLHRATLESTADGLLVVDQSGRPLSFNQRFLDMWRIPPEVAAGGLDGEMIGHVLGQLADPDGFLARVGELYADPEASSYDEIRFKDGRIYERYSQPQRIRGRSVGRVWSFRDVTERRRAEEALKESERLLELFFSQSLDGFFFMMLDEPVRWDDTTDKEAALDYVFAHQRITKVNDAMLAQYGATREQLIGLTPGAFYAHDLAHGRAVWRQFFDAGQLHVETDERKLDGTPVTIEGDYICLYDQEGRIIGHFGIQRDVTERRRADEALLRSREELRDLTARLQSVREEERTRIAREIHDELGQALTGLKIDLAWIKTRVRDRYQVLERVGSVVSRVDGTMDAVRRIATELRPSVLDHLGLVAAVEWQAQEFERQTGIAVALEVKATDLTVDDVRATTAFRILQETLTNVARHAEATRVAIALAVSDGDLRLDVRDNGRGITAAEIAGRRSLGLVGLRERAIACGGELKIRGTPGRGTKVSVRIPLAPRGAAGGADGAGAAT